MQASDRGLGRRPAWDSLAAPSARCGADGACSALLTPRAATPGAFGSRSSGSLDLSAAPTGGLLGESRLHSSGVKGPALRCGPRFARLRP